MLKFIKAVLLVLVAVAALLAAQTSNPAAPTSNSAVNAIPQSMSVRILTPVADQNLTATFVDVRFEVLNPAADAGSPNFLIQLDGRDPVRTTGTQYTFTGLTPGTHTITVTLVDANDTPVLGGRAAVQFAVSSASQQHGSLVQGTPLRAVLNPELSGAADEKQAGMANADALPVLSIIGFGVLIGGVASALKTR